MNESSNLRIVSVDKVLHSLQWATLKLGRLSRQDLSNFGDQVVFQVLTTYLLEQVSWHFDACNSVRISTTYRGNLPHG